MGKNYWRGTKPKVFSGQRSEYHGWKIKLMTHLRLNVDARVDDWMDWARGQKGEIIDALVDREFGD